MSAQDRCWDKRLRTGRTVFQASAVSSTFATHQAADSSGECQIQNSTRYLYLQAALDSIIRKSARREADADVRIGPLGNHRDAIRRRWRYKSCPGRPRDMIG